MKAGISGVPFYKARYGKYFYHGLFESMFGEPVPAGVRSAKFVAENGNYIVAFWNTTETDAKFELYGKGVCVPAKDVAVVEYNR